MGSPRGRGGPLSELTDRMLVARALEQDPAATEEIVRRHTPVMRAYAYRVIGVLADAEDVVQDAFVIAWERLHTLKDPDALRAWLMRITGRAALTHRRKRPVEVALHLEGFETASTPAPDAVAIRNAQLAALGQALDRLPQEQRDVWLLREVGELSYTEIAEELERPISTIRGLLARARISITTQMEGWR